MQADLTKLIDLAEQVVSSLGLSLVDVRLAQLGKNRSVEVTIYKPSGRIGLDDCEQVSRKLDALLEEQTPPVIDGHYLLEVQSPGTDRKLSTEREFALFTGQLVEIKTKQKVEGLGSAFTGKLAGYADGQLHINQPEKVSDRPKNKKGKPQVAEVTPESIAVEMTNVIHVRLVPTSTIE